MEEQQQHEVSLPGELLRILSARLVQDETPSNRTLQLMAFCGVCRRWRECGRETGEPICLDGSTDTHHGPKATLTRFRRAPVAQKRSLFLGASRLLTGYADLTLSGEAVDDQVLLNIAVANGPSLTSLRVLNAPNVTDAGLCTLISAAPNLKSFAIEGAGPGVVGHFMPTLLQHCKQLESLTCDGGEAINWAALRASGAWAAAMAAAAQAAANADSRAAGRGGYAAAAAAAAAGGQSDDSHRLQHHQQQHQQQPMQPSLSAHDHGHGGGFETHANGGSSSSQRQQHRPSGSSSISRRLQAGAAAGSSSSSAFAAAAAAAAPGPSNAGSGSRHHHHQQEAGPHAHRLSSSSYSDHSTDYSSCPDEAAAAAVGSDDGGDAGHAANSDRSSLDGGSDSTSISMPSQAVEALTQQLQHILSGGGGGSGQQQPMGQHSAAAAAGGAGPSSGSRAQQQSDNRQEHHSSRRCGGATTAAADATKHSHTALRRLRVRHANTDTLQQLLECAPLLTELSLDGPAPSVQAAAALCPGLRRLSYLVCSPAELDAALACLSNMRNLRSLELEVKGMVLSTEQLRVVGLLPLRELSLDSHAYRQHPSMPRPQYSHLDNDGVKGLVDSICSRMRTELMPLKLSLCGATALKQEAVSALLRLPILASIDTGGCVKLTPMDRMRLVAKVKAGQGLLDRSGQATAGAGALQLRLLPQHMML